METVSSSKFRTSYYYLTKQTAVTVNGHVIGVWTPTETFDVLDALSRPITESQGVTEYERLERFNTQPFRGPIPKKGR